MIAILKTITMKTNNIKVIFIATLFAFVNLMYAQKLIIKANFENQQKKNIKAYYTLLSNDSIISKGSKASVKFALKLNTSYILIISKIGYKTKTIRFNTFCPINDDYKFNLEAILFEETAKELVTKSFMVFYDHKFDVFCFKNMAPEDYAYCARLDNMIANRNKH